MASKGRTSRTAAVASVRLDVDRLRTVLSERRHQLGWTIRELAECSGVSSSAVHALEQGNTRAQLDNFVAVLAALGVRPDQVLIVEGNPASVELTAVERKIAEIRQLHDPAEILRRLAELLGP